LTSSKGKGPAAPAARDDTATSRRERTARHHPVGRQTFPMFTEDPFRGRLGRRDRTDPGF
jgi:hypothetical protein